MIKVLLIDDEPWLIKGMQNIIDWELLGFEICATALDGISGLEIVEQQHPQVVFLDIHMPQMNGLEVLSRIKQFDDSIMVIILSGYAEFAYAQKALRIGADDYLLKPLDEDELSKVLNNINGKLAMQFDEKDWVRQITQNRIISNPKKLKEVVSERLKLDNNEKIVIAFIEQQQMTVLPKRYNDILFTVPISESEYIFFAKISCFDNRTKLGELLFSFYQSPVGVSAEFSDFSEFNQAYMQARCAVSLFWGEPKHVNTEPDGIKDDFTKHINRLWNFYNNRNSLAFTAELDEIIERLLSRKVDFNTCVMMYNNLYDMVKSLGGENTSPLLGDITLQTIMNNNAKLTYKERLEIIRTALIEVIKSCNSDDVSSQITTSVNEDAVKVKEYIDNNFTSPNISVKEISNIFYINPAYIGQIFKKSFDESISEYITKKRMDFAEYLLKNKKYSIEEVAEKTGVVDYFYFNKLYKKYKGITPGKLKRGE